MKFNTLVFSASLAFAATLIGACGGSETVKNLSANERFQMGMAKFKDGDFLDAISEFNIVKLQYPGSNVGDSAQFFLADCRFKRDEYLIAAEEYQALRRNYPASPLLADAQYKIALCFYALSPKWSLDQRYTSRAIDEFQTFMEYYPKHPLAADAAGKIQELNTRLAKKDFEIAEMYMKLEYYKAATYYYNSVFEKYHDTPYGEQALLGKVRSLLARRKYDEARPDVDRFKELYPNSPYLGDIRQLEKDIDDHPAVPETPADHRPPERS